MRVRNNFDFVELAAAVFSTHISFFKSLPNLQSTTSRKGKTDLGVAGQGCCSRSPERKNKSSAQVADSEPLPLDSGAGLGCVKEGSDEDGSDDENNVPDDNGSGYELLEQLKNDLFDGVVNALKDAMSATTESSACERNLNKWRASITKNS